MTISVRNSKSRALLFWGHIICLKINYTGIGLRFVQKQEKLQILWYWTEVCPENRKSFDFANCIQCEIYTPKAKTHILYLRNPPSFLRPFFRKIVATPGLARGDTKPTGIRIKKIFKFDFDRWIPLLFFNETQQNCWCIKIGLRQDHFE